MTDRVPIGDYGLIGDTRSAALVAPDGSIDWWCVPRFDDPPLFGRLVGGSAAGWFTVGPAEPAAPARRAYRPDTATLTTTWTVEGGELELADGLVAEVEGRFLPATVLVRRLSARGRSVHAQLHIVPRFGYDRSLPRRVARRAGALVCEHGDLAIAIMSDGPVVDIERPVDVRGQPWRTSDDRHHRRPPQLPDPGPAACRRRRNGPRRGRVAHLGRWRRVRRSPRRGGTQPHRPATSHLLAVWRAGRRAHDLAARASRRGAQLGLPLRLAPRRLDRHRRVPRRRPAARGTGVSLLAPPRQPPVATAPAGAVHPRRAARTARGRAHGLARLRRQPPGPHRQRRRPPASTGRLRLGARRRVVPHRGWSWALRRDVAHGRRFGRPRRRHLDRTRRRDLGTSSDAGPPRPLQVDGVVGPRPSDPDRRRPG